MKNHAAAGHLAALFTILIWGTTFISTKVLLADFAPVEILFCRFVIGYLALLAADRRPIRGAGKRQELTFIGAGLCGICLYYLMENIALTYTMASNVSVIVATAPFFTAFLFWLFMRSEEKLGAGFLLGFLAAMAGIGLVSFNGAQMKLNPLGDVLALGAAVVWGCYSILSKKMGGFGYPLIASTRHTFFYGILFMIPALFLFGFTPDPARFADPLNLFNMVYLGVGGSAACFVSWNYAMKSLGAVRASVYIYLVPVITVIFSALILGEPVTLLSLIGMGLTLLGLLLSQRRG